LLCVLSRIGGHCPVHSFNQPSASATISSQDPCASHRCPSSMTSAAARAAVTG